MEYWLIPSSKLLWSITSSISNLWRQFLHTNAVHNNISSQWSRWDTMTTSSYSYSFHHVANIVGVTRSSATKSRLSITLWISFHFRQLLHLLVACCVVYRRPRIWKGGSCWAGDIAIGGGGGHGSNCVVRRLGRCGVWLCVVVHLAGTHKSTFDG